MKRFLLRPGVISALTLFAVLAAHFGHTSPLRGFYGG
jgi:hypothetical protein